MAGYRGSQGPFKKSRKPMSEKMSDKRAAWLQTGALTSIIFYIPEDDPQDDDDERESAFREPGPTVRLNIRHRGRYISVNLTALTSEELAAMRDFYLEMFDLAKPIVELRDREAQNALANGDDSNFRIYRPLPQLVVRPGAFGGHSEGIHDRLARHAQGDLWRGGGEPLDSADRAGDDGGELADGDPKEGGTQDDGAATD